MEDHPARVVSRATARSGRVGYTAPVPIRDTRDMLIEATRWYIPHATGPEQLAVKLSYERRRGPAAGASEFTLSEDEALRLRDVIDEGLALIGQGADGEYIALRLNDLEDRLGAEPGTVASRLVRILNRPEIASRLEAHDFGDELLAILGSAVHLRDLRLAVDQLRGHLDAGENNERVYQAWCRRHAWAFGSAYAVPDEVRRIALGDEVDILVASTLNGLRDVLELKRPDRPVMLVDEPHRSRYFSQEVSKAIGQCHRYLDALHEAAQKGLRDNPQIRAYHPRAVIVIGRSNTWSEDQLMALHGLNGRLHGVSVMTYDQLLAQGERMLEILEGPEVGE